MLSSARFLQINSLMASVVKWASAWSFLLASALSAAAPKECQFPLRILGEAQIASQDWGEYLARRQMGIDAQGRLFLEGAIDLSANYPDLLNPKHLHWFKRQIDTAFKQGRATSSREHWNTFAGETIAYVEKIQATEGTVHQKQPIDIVERAANPVYPSRPKNIWGFHHYQYIDALRLKLKHLAKDDVDAALKILEGLPGIEDLTKDFRIAFSRIKQNDSRVFHHALNLFIDFVTVKGDPFYVITQTAPGFDQRLGDKDLAFHELFNYWKTLRFIGRQEEIFSNSSQSATVFLDSSLLIDRGDQYRMPLGDLYKIGHDIALMSGQKVNFEILPTATREMGYPAIDRHVNDAPSLYIPLEFQNSLTERQKSDLALLDKEFTHVLTQSYKMDYPDQAKDHEFDARLLSEALFASREITSRRNNPENNAQPHLFATMDTHIIKALNRLAHRNLSLNRSGLETTVTRLEPGYYQGRKTDMFLVQLEKPFRSEVVVFMPGYFVQPKPMRP
jgi:hypothetical protein